MAHHTIHSGKRPWGAGGSLFILEKYNLAGMEWNCQDFVVPELAGRADGNGFR